jgi:TatD DNase family protein
VTGRNSTPGSHSGDPRVATGLASRRSTFADTHAHLQGEEYAGDLGAVIERARAAGVERIIVPGVDVETSRSAMALAEAYDGLYAAAGSHPHEASRLDPSAFAEIVSMLPHPRVVAVGEIGLDYYYNHSPREDQLACIERMLGLAEAWRLPVIVHCRDAWDDMATVLGPWARRVCDGFGQRPVGVMHYFSGTLEQARFYIDLGFVLSVHTSVTHKKQEAMRGVVAQLPLESLVIETDSPYGAPQAYRGKRNEPAYVVEAAAQIAALHSVSLDAVAAATSANAARLFQLPVGTGTVSAMR